MHSNIKSIEKLIDQQHFCNDLLDTISEKLYLSGMSYLKISHKKRQLFSNPIIIFSILSVVLVRELTSLLLHDHNISRMIGDLSFNWRLKSIWNLTLIFGINLALGSHTIHYYYSLKNIYHFWPIRTSTDETRIATNNSKIKLVTKFMDTNIKVWQLIGFLFTLIVYSFTSSFTCRYCQLTNGSSYRTAYVFTDNLFLCYVL